jgi:hypothetical protein
MANLVTLTCVEKQHVIRVGYRLVPTHMSDINAAVRENQMRGGGEFLGAAVSALS